MATWESVSAMERTLRSHGHEVGLGANHSSAGQVSFQSGKIQVHVWYVISQDGLGGVI